MCLVVYVTCLVVGDVLLSCCTIGALAVLHVPVYIGFVGFAWVLLSQLLGVFCVGRHAH